MTSSCTPFVQVTFEGPIERDNLVNTGPDGEDGGTQVIVGELWDLNRALPASCSMELLKFEDKEGRMVFCVAVRTNRFNDIL